MWRSISDYILPLTKVMTELGGIGIILRTIYTAYQSWLGEEEATQIFHKSGKKIIAGICLICIAELLEYVAQLFGYS